MALGNVKAPVAADPTLDSIFDSASNTGGVDGAKAAPEDKAAATNRAEVLTTLKSLLNGEYHQTLARLNNSTAGKL